MSGRTRRQTVRPRSQPCPRCHTPLVGHGMSNLRRTTRRHLEFDHLLAPGQAAAEAWRVIPPATPAQKTRALELSGRGPS